MDSQMLLNTGIRVNQALSAVFMLFGLLMLLIRKNAPIAEAVKVKLFPLKEGKAKPKKAKPAEEFDISKVSDDLKLMDDAARTRRMRPKEGLRKKEPGSEDKKKE